MCARVKASRISRLELLARVVGEHSENNKVFHYSLVLYLIYFFSSIFTHTFCLFIPFVFIYFFILYFWLFCFCFAGKRFCENAKVHVHWLFQSSSTTFTSIEFSLFTFHSFENLFDIVRNWVTFCSSSQHNRLWKLAVATICITNGNFQKRK